MEDSTIDEQLKSAGMLTVQEIMAGGPIDGFMVNAGVNDLESFSKWLDMRTKEMLSMKAAMMLKNKAEGELFGWVLAHSAVLNEVRVNFNAATK